MCMRLVLLYTQQLHAVAAIQRIWGVGGIESNGILCLHRRCEVHVVQKLCKLSAGNVVGFFSVRKGCHGNFVISTALLVLSASVVHCIVIAQS